MESKKLKSDVPNQDYYLGLDIGTNSVGWAVTDANYNLLRAKGKDLWGVRKFKEAKTAEERRGVRSGRRRIERKRLRLQLLREIFEEKIHSVDPNFLKRLDESKYWLEDKKVEGKFSLFNDKGFTDKDFFEIYPTIFHLRKDLMISKEKKDIRLYFLAINQIMKHRGHFIFENQSINNIADVTPYRESLDEVLRSEVFNIELENEFFDELIRIISELNTTRTDKTNSVKKLIQNLKLDKSNEKILISITKLIISGKTTINSIFPEFETKDLEVKDFNFTSESYDSDFDNIKEELGYDFELIEILKAIYDYSKLQEVLLGSENISNAQIKRYEKHAADLNLLKSIYKNGNQIQKDCYKNMFSSELEQNNYVRYIGTLNKQGKKITLTKVKKADDFFKKIVKDIDEFDFVEEHIKSYIKSEISNGTFLPKQMTSANSVIPYQIHLAELKSILKNLKRDYPSFGEEIDGIDSIKKIELLFTFRIPYFVGPLNGHHKSSSNGFAWIVRNKNEENTKIRPWNFEEVVDLNKSEEEFIKRMTNYCTYLPDQKVLPKNSILYSEYLVFDELNNLKVNGESLDVKVKNDIFNKLYLKQKKVTAKKILSYLKANNLVDDDATITGFDRELKASMSSFIDLQNTFESDFNIDKAEQIIEWITIHGGDASRIKDKVKSIYPDINDTQLGKLNKLKFSDWGRLSEKFLNGIEGAEFESGVVGTIMYFMKNASNNLMQVLSGKYSFMEDINKYALRFVPSKITYETIDNLYVSPSVKKMIWQVLKITNELVKVLGREPKRIFVEMARGKEDIPERKESRKTQLIELYKSFKSEEKDWISEINNRSESELRSETLYLYYTQMGQCMYSGDLIPLSDLFNRNLYDIDHIIPKSLKKDDSTINNKVLVKKHLNQDVKKDEYPLPEKIKKYKVWEQLLSKNLITQTKYERLMRSTPLTDEELAGFINRQLVETRQSTKIVANLLGQEFKKSKIVYVKSGLVSEFRQDFEMLKLREVNDLHHAHDAFLNIVVGNGYYTKFTSNALQFIKDNNRKYTLNKIFKGVISKNSKTVWDVSKDSPRIKKTVAKPSPIITTEPYEDHGSISDVNPISAKAIKKGTLYLPLKKDDRLKDMKKYGGYNSLSIAYFFIVEHTLKKTRVTTIESLPIYISKEIENGKLTLEEYCLMELKLINPVIKMKKLLKKSLIEVEGFKYLINGKSGNDLVLQPNLQAFWNQEQINIIRDVIKAKLRLTTEKGYECEDLNRSKLISIVKAIQLKLMKPPFCFRMNLPEIALEYDFEKSGITSKELCVLISKMLILVSDSASIVDLSIIGGKKELAKVRINKNISTPVKLIFQSVTGLFEQEVILS